MYMLAIKCTFSIKVVCTTMFFIGIDHIRSVTLYILTIIPEEYRPQEKRDKTDYTELTALSCFSKFYTASTVQWRYIHAKYEKIG